MVHQHAGGQPGPNQVGDDVKAPGHPFEGCRPPAVRCAQGEAAGQVGVVAVQHPADVNVDDLAVFEPPAGQERMPRAGALGAGADRDGDGGGFPTGPGHRGDDPGVHLQLAHPWPQVVDGGVHADLGDPVGGAARTAFELERRLGAAGPAEDSGGVYDPAAGRLQPPPAAARSGGGWGR